jgi:hypothetical protein
MAICRTAPLYAQADRGIITGLVLDPTGAAVPDATVEIRDSLTGVVTKLTSSSTGNYSSPPLVIGTYEVSVTRTGFKVFHASGINLASGQTFRQDVQLQMGQVGQSIEVNAKAELLNTDNPQVSGSVNQTYYEALPAILYGQNHVPESLLYTLPQFVGLTQGQIYPGSVFSGRINGGERSGLENYLDGASYGEVGSDGNTQERSVPLESVQEARLIANTFSAQYGHTSGGFVEYTTKSGTSTYHGGAYEYVNNDIWDARGEIPPTTPPTRQNEFGFTLGGPIQIPKIYNGKNKSFFFFNLDLFRYRNPGLGAGYVTIPDAAGLGGDFSEFLNATTPVGTDACGRAVYSGEIFDPATTRDASTCGGPSGVAVRDPLSGNQVPTTEFSKVASNIQSYLPPPANSNIYNNYLVGPEQRYLNSNVELVRGDHNFTDKIRLSVTALHSARPRLLDCNYVGGCTSVVGDPRVQDIITNTDHIQLTDVISPTLFTHAVMSFDHHNEYNKYPLIDGKGWASKVGITGIPFENLGGFPNINFDQTYSGFGVDGTGYFYGSTRWQFLDDTTKIIGSHTLKFGFEYRHERWYDSSAIGDAGVFNFSVRNTGAFDVTGVPISGTGNAYASFLLGQVSSSNFSIPAFPDYRRPYFAPWINDDWKATKKLTLSFGFRFDLQFPRTGRNNEYSSFDPNLPNPGAGNIPGAIAFAGQNGFSTTLFEKLHADTYGPRFGLAYRVSNTTVFRGGYGIYYAPVMMGQFAATPDFGYSTSPSVVDLTNGRQAIFNLDNGFPASAVTVPPLLTPDVANGTGVLYQNPDGIKLPRYQNWTLSVERMLARNLMLDVAYVGNHGTREIGNGDSQDDISENNPALLAEYPASLLTSDIYSSQAAAAGFKAPYAGFDGSVAQAIRPYPQYSSVTQFNGADAWSTYNSLQASLEKRFSGGLQANISWVHSRMMNNGGESALANGFGGNPNISTYLPQKARSMDDIPNVVTVTFVDYLPFGSGQRFLNRRGIINGVLGGWRTGGSFRYENGRPLGITMNNAYGAILFNDGDVPDRVAPGGYLDTNNSNFDIVNSRYLSLTPFANHPTDRLGNEDRVDSFLRGWANYNENLSLYKDFTIKEQATWRVGVNSTNLLNRHQWCDPNTNWSTGSYFGQVSGQCNTQRMLEIYMKVNF